MKNNLSKAGFSHIIVPRVHKELCSKKLMVMDEIKPSIPLHDALDQQAEALAKQKGIPKEQVCGYMCACLFICVAAWLVSRTLPSCTRITCPQPFCICDCLPHVKYMKEEKARVEAEARELAKQGKVIEAVSAADYDKYIKLQKSKRGIKRGLKTLYNYTLGWVAPNFDMSDDNEGVFVPLNAARLVDDLLSVHGHEILIDGYVSSLCCMQYECLRMS